MKNLATGTAVGTVLLAAASAFSQVQIFEQDLAGIHPYAGVNWNSKIIQPVLGFEYSIEGRTSMGLMAAKPLKDTLAIPGVKAFLVNPYIAFEFIEPGNLTLLSFSLRADYIFEDVYKSQDSLTMDSLTGLPPTVANVNSFSRSSYGVGPVFALRFQTSDKITVIPEAAYALYFVTWRWTRLGQLDTTKNPPVLLPPSGKNSNIWHEISAGVNVLYRFNEAQGVNFEPKVVIKVRPGLSKGEQSSSLVNAEIRLGYFVSF